MNEKEVIKQKGFRFEKAETHISNINPINGFFPMRHWQVEAFNILKESHAMILNAPMGSGKSWLMCLLSAFKMKSDDSLRCVIAVPQTIIAPGFVEAKLRMPDGENIHWTARHNLCDEESNASTVTYFIKWLERPCDSFSDRILICTHATLVAMYKKLKTQGRSNLLKNLLVWIDEAHHVKNTSMEDFEGASNSNSIGAFVGFLLNSNENHNQLGLTTASFFRGDRHSLLTDDMERQFKRFNLPYDEYLESMEHLESFSFDFLVCGHDYTKAIEILIKNRRGKDIIYVPHPKSRCSTGDKYREVENIIAKYQEINGGEVIDIDNGLTVLQSVDCDFKILDLVDEDRRIEKKNYINSPLIKYKREALDVIISLGMFKEGANWIWADRSIIVGARSSLVDVIQMIGRLFRDAKDKKQVEVIQLLPFSFDQQDEEFFKHNLNNYLKAIYASLILEDILNPVKIKIPKERKQNIDKEDRDRKPKNLLSELVPDETKQLSLIEEVSNQLMGIIDDNKDAGKSVPILWDEYQKIIPEILKKYDIETVAEVEDVSKLIWGKFARRTLAMQGISVENIDFDILQNTHPLEGLLRYTSSACGIDTFKKLRATIRSYGPPLTLSIILDWAIKFREKHNRKPTQNDGLIEFANGEYVGITWAAVNSSLWKGGRGLPGGSSLAILIEENLGIRNKSNLRKLSVELICCWIQKYIDKYSCKPLSRNGVIEFADGEYEGMTWERVDSSLYEGLRGLPGRHSLAKLIEEKFGIRSYGNAPNFSLDLIHNWIQSYILKYKKKPTVNDGIIEFATDEFEGTTWAIIAHAMSNGVRGLQGDLTLAQYIEQKFNISNHYDLKPISIEILIKWINQHIEIHGHKPTQNDGVIEFVPKEYEGIKWSRINQYLWKGGRGLPGGSSLAQFIEIHIGIGNRNTPPDFTEELIQKWILAYCAKNQGKTPNKSSGVVEFAEEKYKGTTWACIDSSFKRGKRGLSMSSLALFIQKFLGIRRRTHPPDLSYELILTWVKKYYFKYKRKPTTKDGLIEFAEDEYKGITWVSVDAALRRGRRGLTRRLSLANLIHEKLSIKNHLKTH